MKLQQYGYILLSSLFAFSAQAQELAAVDQAEPIAAETEMVETTAEADLKVGDVVEVEDAAELEEKPTKPVHMLEHSMRNALSKAYETNPQLEAQRRVFQATVEQVPQALSGALPSVAAGYSKGRQRIRSNGANWNHGNTELQSLTLSQPLFRGGTTYANTKAARRVVEAALARLKQTEQDVLLQAITAYVDVVRAHAVLDLSVKNRDVLRQQMDAASQRFEVGEDTRTDVAQSEARAALAESEVINSKGRLESFKAIYREVIGEVPSNLKAPQNLPKLPRSLNDLTEQALATNPAIQEAKALVESADYQIDANAGSLLPSLTLEGSMTRQEGGGIFGTTDFDQDQIVVSANMPLYQGGRTYSLVRQAKETYQQRRFELLDASTAVRRQAVAAWEDLLAATATIASNKSAIEAAEIALEGVRQEQQYGSRTTLDVLDAERELFNAQVQLVVAERDEIVAAYSVLAVLGELTAENLGLDVTLYDAEGYYDDTEYQFIGF